MTAEELTSKIKATFAEKVEELPAVTGIPAFKVKPEHLEEVCTTLVSDPELNFDNLPCLGGIDYPETNEIGVVYCLFSFVKRHHLNLRVLMPRENPEVISVSKFWVAADWFERETAELFGIKFKDHPDLRPLLLIEEWDEGYPMRKDWEGKDFIRMPEVGQEK